MRSGAAQPHVYAKDISALKILLPPLPEQLLIAAILDQDDSLRAKRREALAQLDSLDDPKKFTKRCKAEYLDILYTKVGATYGRPALVNTDKEFSLYVSVCLIKPERKLVDSFFLNAALGTAAIKSQADRRIKGIGVPDLHLDQIQNLLIPLPTMEEQRKFEKRVASVDHLKNKHHASLSELDALFASLQYRAFRGEL